MMTRRNILFSLFLSFLIHLLVFTPVNTNIFTEKNSDTASVFKVRVIGEDEGVKKVIPLIKDKRLKRKMNASDLREKFIFPETQLLKSRSRSSKRSAKVLKPAIKNLRISNNHIKEYLKSDSSFSGQSPSELLSALENTDALFDLQVPKGVKEDELNKHEMVFYSFRRRAALAYVNSFYKELNSFERKNPHIRFPITTRKEKIAGKITYDKNGDILKIQTLKWSHVDKLQDFFMEVLKNMSSLPNPPGTLINEDDQFVINFSLTVNS